MGKLQKVVDIDIRVGGDGWPLTDELRARIDAHWQALTAKNPHLWNGTVFGVVAPGTPRGLSFEDGVLRGTALSGGYADFLAWRDWGFPEIGIRNLFASALVLGADGTLVYGVMNEHTANAGRVFPPGGSLEPRDVRDGDRLDVFGSAVLELAEETGLQAADAEWRGAVVAFDGPRVAIGSILAYPEEGEAIAARIRQWLAREEQPELKDVMVVRGAGDLPAGRHPGFAAMFANDLLGP